MCNLYMPPAQYRSVGQKHDTDGAGLPDITGVMVSYYFICRTKLWLFAHNITLERDYDAVRQGKEIHENSYRREKREIELPGMKLDFVRKGNALEIHEVKKSKKMTDADRYQLLYYLYRLHEMGIEATGILNYPLLKDTLEVIPDEKDFARMQEIEEEIRRIIAGPYIEPKYRKICRKCAYFEFCFGGDEDEG